VRTPAYGFWRLAFALLGLAWPLLTFGGQAKSQGASRASRASNPAPNQDDSAQTYRNSTFKFHYAIPYGWVDRTQEMNEPDQNTPDVSAPGKQSATQITRPSVVLLAVFEHPPEATSEAVNSAAVFAAESAATYPGLKKAEDYLGPLTELAKANGFQTEGEPFPLEVESRQLVRADFSKPLSGAASRNSPSSKLTMHQCTLILLAQGRIVSFTFIAGTEDELDELMDGLHFGPEKSSVR